MFHMLGVTLCCLLGACPVFVAGTGRQISSLNIDKPGILTPIFHSVSGVHVRTVQQLLPVPFRSVLGFIPSQKNWNAEIAGTARASQIG